MLITIFQQRLYLMIFFFQAVMNILGPLLLLAFAGQVKAWWAQPTGYGGGHAQASAHASATAHASGYGATHSAGYGASTHSSGYGGGHAAAAGQQGGNYSPPGYGYGSYTKPVDCVVSAWGAWSQPDASGYSSRFRQVKTTPTNGGRSCPVLVETKLGKS